MLYRTFSDDDSEEDSSAQGPEYSFAGYNVEFSEKIALTPAAATSKAQSMSRAYAPRQTAQQGRNPGA
jgi:hypothetical protein